VKLATTFLAPFIVTVAVAPFAESTPLHTMGRPYPAAAVAVNVTTVPAAYAPPEGLTVPAPAGLTDVVTVYCDACAVNAAVSVVADAVMLCEAAPPSLQDANEYVLPAKVCGEDTPTVCEDPGAHENARGVAYDCPSTIAESPAGAAVIVIVTVGLE